MAKHNSIKTIIFDAGGVLFYINEYRNSIMSRVLSSIGYEQNQIEVALSKGLDFDREYFSSGNEIIDWNDEKKWLVSRANVIAKVLDENYEELSDKLQFLAFDTFQYKLFDETVEVLESLKHEYQLTVLSNATASLDWAFDYLDIRKYFDEVIISSYEKCEKPDMQIYEIALKKIGKKPEQCIFIDDKVENVEAAKSLGILGFHLDRNQGMNLYHFKENL